MEWTKLDVAGRVTALCRGVCAGVTESGEALVATLCLPHVPVRVADDVLLDSVGVVGVSPGDGRTWFTGRGSDGRLHLWEAASEPGTPVLAHSLEPTGAMWAAPVLDVHAAALLASDFRDGAWRLRAYPRSAATGRGEPRGRELVLSGTPDASLSLAFHEKSPLVVAGPLGDARGAAASAWVIGDLEGERSPGPDGDWRRVHLSPAPTELCSASVGHAGLHLWLGGHLDGRPVVYDVLRLPFRGPVRSAHVPVPRVELAPAALDGAGRPLVLVDEAWGDQPTFVAATTRGNRLCWHDGTEWKAHPVPDGRLGAACLSEDGAVHVLVDGAVWSLPDPFTEGHPDPHHG